MNSEPFDLLALVICIAVVVYMPISGLRSHRKLLRWTAEGRSDARTHAYRKVLLTEWGLTAVLLGWWFASGRTAAEIRLVPTVNGWQWIAVGVGAAACVFLLLQMRSVMRSTKQLGQVRTAASELVELAPHNPDESRMFDAVSFTAGVCEEILYRGILLTLVAGWLGTPLAAILTSVAFGAGHAYQGFRGIVKTSLVGGVMALLAIFSGSLFIAILLHWTIDATSGRMLGAAAQLPTESSLDAAPGPDTEAGPQARTAAGTAAGAE